MSNEAQPGMVYLVGAGPGDPGLLTLRAAELLKTCDVILPDDLVSDAILDLASPTAQIIPVGKRCGQPRITQAGIHELMLHHASPNNGHHPSSVLRLKSGDPLVFGRAGEEIAFLREHGIPFEIVPGISAAFAVAASLQTPSQTAPPHPSSSSPPPTTPIPKTSSSSSQNWSGAFPDDATFVLYMPGRAFRSLADDLIASGIPPNTPCVAVSKATTSEQQIHSTTLAQLQDGRSRPPPPSLALLIGRAIQLQ